MMDNHRWDSMSQHNKGTSPLISGVTYIGVGIATMALIVGGLTSFSQQAEDTSSINEMIETMPVLEEAIRSVASTGEGTQRSLAFTFERGEIRTYPGDNTIEYLIDTTSGIISPQTSQKIGNVEISAGADVDINTTTINGTECWQITNRHIQTCIARIDQGPDKSLVGYWPMDALTGQTVQDEGRYGNEGQKGATNTSDTADPERIDACQIGGCLDFDGENDYVNASDLDSNGSMTVMAWFRLDQAPGNGLEDAIVVSDAGGSINRGFQLHFNDGSLEGTIRDGENTSTVTSTAFSSSDIGQWHHVALMIDADTDETSLYLNGEEVDTDTTADSHRSVDRPTIIGAYHGPSQQFDGQIDEVAVYNRSMTTTELEGRYELLEYSKDFIRTEDLLLQYRNTNTGQEIDDPEIEATINGREASSYGFGHTAINAVGEGLPNGRVTATIEPLTPISYSLQMTIPSGSDFIETTIRPD